MNLKRLALPAPYRIPVLTLLLSFACIAAHLYQMEIITIWLANDIFHYEFPFYLERLFGYENGINIWVARDFWYWVDCIGGFLAVWSGYKLGLTYVYIKYRRILEDEFGNSTEVKN